MTIQINTDNNINGTEALTTPYVAQIESELSSIAMSNDADSLDEAIDGHWLN